MYYLYLVYFLDSFSNHGIDLCTVLVLAVPVDYVQLYIPGLLHPKRKSVPSCHISDVTVLSHPALTIHNDAQR
jgi:hypothetical protein